MEDDDLLVPEEDVSLFLGHPVTLEEKIDGANVGISLDLDNCFDDGSPAFRFQKRSHYVSAASESQFRGLDTWAEENAVALRRLLTIPFGRDRKPAKAGQRQCTSPRQSIRRQPPKAIYFHYAVASGWWAGRVDCCRGRA